VNVPTFLSGQMVDRVMLITTNLAEELYVLYDRLAVIEHLLEKKGVLMRREIESFVPDDRFEAELKAFREALMGRLFSQAVGSPPSSA